MVTMLNDIFGVARSDLDEPNYSSEPIDGDEPENEELNGDKNGDNAEFYKLLEDGNEELYGGCTKYAEAKEIQEFTQSSSCKSFTSKLAAAASSSQACQQALANPATIHPSITSSTNSETSSRTSSMAPTTSENSSGARRKRGRESKRYWKVQDIG
ncbi:hypothetical protein PIB30_075910 [Stylosanthes scabra]|uniref:Uncharacterized protein n=1 Tax=Stylosanthes scabra TaxID=79078 RepID=A0ABU6UNU2_9FABA|nr:hypothetical protein [Stylosanthes scabra]